MHDRLGSEKAKLQVASAPVIENRIYLIRGRQVMFDEDLAADNRANLA